MLTLLVKDVFWMLRTQDFKVKDAFKIVKYRTIIIDWKNKKNSSKCIFIF
jgi:hypothetical protein